MARENKRLENDLLFMLDTISKELNQANGFQSESAQGVYKIRAQRRILQNPFGSFKNGIWYKAGKNRLILLQFIFGGT